MNDKNYLGYRETKYVRISYKYDKSRRLSPYAVWGSDGAQHGYEFDIVPQILDKYLADGWSIINTHDDERDNVFTVLLGR